MREPADLLFDLDGTISDPLDGIFRSFNFALSSHGFEPVPERAVAALVGPPLDDGFRSLVPGADDKQIQTLVSSYRERYAESGFAENRIYDGVSEALSELKERGFVLGVCTSKRRDFAERILEHLGIRGRFAFVDGGDVGVKKQEQIAALSGAGLVSESSRMIGDRAVDIVAARANGLSSVGVLWGYGSESELREAGADVILRHAKELSQLVGAA